MKKLLILPAFALAACGSESPDVVVTHYDNGIIAQTSVKPVGSNVDTPRTVEGSDEGSSETGIRDRRDGDFRDVIITDLRLDTLEIGGLEFDEFIRFAVVVGHCPWGIETHSAELDVSQLEGLALHEFNDVAYNQFMEMAPELGWNF